VDKWSKLKEFTSARVGLGRVGFSLPTQKVLEFQRAHSAARNAVWCVWDYQTLINDLIEQGETPIQLSTEVHDRETYLRFPNKGRLLSSDSCEALRESSTDIAFIVSDGLSALAVTKHFLPLWNLLKVSLSSVFPELTYRLFLVPYSRVAIADPIGEQVKAKLSVIFIGERPGLNSADSLGIYMTYSPMSGNSDAQRNCISNVREPLGMSYRHASAKLEYLMRESLRLQLSGVNLKDEMDLKLIK
jgi:ethanolamine ammonia-lyase small subunit